jgi:hypothetical protein
MNIQAALVRSILQQWRSYEWTVQGFGFVRTKIADVGRIHVWDSRLAVQLVSTMHSHPWPLRSTIISGELINCRFVRKEDRVVPFRLQGMRYAMSRIATGEGGGLMGEPGEIELFGCQPEQYVPGDLYEQRPDEIHRTIAQDGTVTLLERPQGPPLEEALTFWPAGTNWVSAEPGKVEEWRLQPVMDYALARWSACSPATVRGEHG